MNVDWYRLIMIICNYTRILWVCRCFTCNLIRFFKVWASPLCSSCRRSIQKHCCRSHTCPPAKAWCPVSLTDTTDDGVTKHLWSCPFFTETHYCTNVPAFFFISIVFTKFLLTTTSSSSSCVYVTTAVTGLQHVVHHTPKTSGAFMKSEV